MATPPSSTVAHLLREVLNVRLRNVSDSPGKSSMRTLCVSSSSGTSGKKRLRCLPGASRNISTANPSFMRDNATACAFESCAVVHVSTMQTAHVSRFTTRFNMICIVPRGADPMRSTSKRPRGFTFFADLGNDTLNRQMLRELSCRLRPSQDGQTPVATRDRGPLVP